MREREDLAEQSPLQEDERDRAFPWPRLALPPGNARFRLMPPSDIVVLRQLPAMGIEAWFPMIFP